MRLQLVTTISAILFLLGCATTHPGLEGHAVDQNSHMPIKISAQTIDDAQNEAFQLIEVTVENTSDDWLRINNSQVVINNPAQEKISVVMGKDLDAWAEAMKFQLQRDEHNKDIIQAGLLTAGAIAVAASNKGKYNEGTASSYNKGLFAAGAIAVAGTAVWAVGDAISYSYSKATQTNKAPDSHLYSPFTVPGKMFLRRWVLLNKPSDRYIQKLVVEIETVEGDKGLYEITL